MAKNNFKKRATKTTLFSRITRSVVSLIVGLFLVVGIVLGSIVYITSHNTMMDQLDTTSTAYALAIEKDLGIFQEQVRSIGQYASNLEGELQSQSINKLLDQMKSDYGFVSIYSINKSGATSTPGVTVNDREYFQAAIKGGFYASSPFLKSDNTVGITVAGPVYRNNTIDGIVSVGINYDYFSRFVDFQIGRTGSSIIIDKNGTIVASLDTKKVESFYNPTTLAQQEQQYKSQAAMFSSFLSGNSASHRYTAPDGIKKVAIAKPISGTDNWLLVTSMDVNETNETATMVLSLLAIIVLVGLGIGIGCTMLLARSISNPIKNASNRLAALSNGDLSSNVELARSNDEIQTLSEALQDTIAHLCDYIKEIETVTVSMATYNLDISVLGEFRGEFLPIKESLNKILLVMNHSFSEIASSSDQVNAGADQVSSAAQTLSQGATEQAGSIEELSATINMVSSQIKDNAGDADSAKIKVNQIGSQIEVSGQKMLDLVAAMDNISHSSDKIGKIIKTIDDIAFQTNILALNAAVEAARAGVAGKGFAVVADEVRNLASKSAEASKSTTDLIQNSMDAVSSGTQIANEMAQHLEMVVQNVKDVVVTIERISEASSDQAVSIGEITIGIEQISAVVQGNSATAEQSAAASEELSGQSAVLKDLTDRFVLSETKQSIYS